MSFVLNSVHTSCHSVQYYGRLIRKIALGIIKKRFFKNVIDNSKTEILTVEQKIDKFLNVHLNLSLRHC